ncbi:MAG TPA: DUF5689 domain-containing protein [Bacteroidia bacterium]|nr:DUF5689 domain-containing protein [Bacteroidia bacterium]
MKNTKRLYFIPSTIIAVVIMVFFSCKKTPSDPPVKQAAIGPKTTIDSLRNMYQGMSIKFTSNTILNAVVTCDESSGSLYKQVYVRDNSGEFAVTNHYGAIALRFTHGTSGMLTVGDSIAVNLNGSTLAKSSGGSLEIDSIDAINQVVHLKSGLNPQPLVVTLPQLNSYSTTPSNPLLKQFIYDAQLVQLNNVEFIQPNVGTTYAIYQAPPVIAAPKNVNKYICDATGNTMVAYNSGYANFATQIIPNNSGSIVAVANLYTTMQLTIRSDANGDINLNQPYSPIVYDTITQNFNCAALFTKTNIFTAGWQTIAYKGAVNWQGAQYGNPAFGASTTSWKYAPSASNYKTNDVVNDMWLVSPPIVDNVYAHGGTATKYIDFTSAGQFAGPTSKVCVSVLVSRSFDGTNIIPSQWQDISVFFNRFNQSVAPPNFKWSHSSTYGSSVFTPAHVPITVGPLPSGASTPTFYIAFRCQTNTTVADSTGTSYFIGSLLLKNN